jgi:hypothetical protein
MCAPDKGTGLAQLARELARTGPRARLLDAWVDPTALPRRPETQPHRYLMCIPEIARAITSCWISAVPSKMS